MLEEAGVDYDIEVIDIRDAKRKDSDAFRSASPMGKVPALVDGDLRMSESAAICLYLADRYARGILAPDFDDSLRGSFLYWMFYTPAVIEPAMSDRFNKVAVDRGRSGWGDFDLMLETLAAGLGTSEWILGGRFTAADVMLGSSGLFRQQFGMLPESEALAAYGGRCAARPAYRAARALDEPAA
jgi:glutathione S-transferase